ncbi:MAG: cytochrome ubiquinol oxidase subunit I [Puia sp.]
MACFYEKRRPHFSGLPFSLEGTAFFIDAIALGFICMGWGKFNKWFHWFTGVVVGVSGLISGHSGSCGECLDEQSGWF